MSGKKQTQKVCPYLGLAKDPLSHFSYPEDGHICLVTDDKKSIELEHQKNFCLGKDYVLCSRYVEPAGESTIIATVDDTQSDFSSKTLLYAGGGVIIGLLLVLSIVFSSTNKNAPTTSTLPVQLLVNRPSVTPTADITVTDVPTAIEVSPTNTREINLVASQTTAIPISNAKTITLNAVNSTVGWVSGEDSRRNHFGDSYIYAGVFNERTYIGGFQIDLSAIPRGAPIHSGILRMTGLREDLLAIQNDMPDDGQVWKVALLDEVVDDTWFTVNYQTLLNASVSQTLNPLLGASDLGNGVVNEFKLTTEQLRILKDKIVDNLEPKLSFRVTGPLAGDDNLFAWDTGYGSQSKKKKIELVLTIGEAPVTPIPYNYIVVTSTPTPENVVTAAAIVTQMTADATKIGTATPPPPNMVTATPVPRYLVLEPSPTPGNLETATAQMVLATAFALTTGTPTPLPPNMITATPLPSPSPTYTATPAQYVLITATPTPDSIFAAATLSARLTAEAQIFGTPTQIPLNWVTPVVETVTPTPGNAATTQALAQLATAIALTTGTPSPTPENSVLATPTPIFNEIALLPTPTIEAAPEEIPPIPSALLGKILFKSDREDDPLAVYIYDPETGTVGRLTDPWPYDVARERNSYSADKRYRVYTRVPEFSNEDRLQIHIADAIYDDFNQLTHFGVGNAYDSVLSPVADRVAMVATESGNDDIWVISLDGTGLQRLTFNDWEGDKSPTWSPDGTKIVFQSNSTGNNQLWIMNADGSEQQLLFGWENWTPYNDTYPVWVKYLDSAP